MGKQQSLGKGKGESRSWDPGGQVARLPGSSCLCLHLPSCIHGQPLQSIHPCFSQESGVASHLTLDKEDTVRMLYVFASTLPGLGIPEVLRYLCIFFKNQNRLWIFVIHLYLQK